MARNWTAAQKAAMETRGKTLLVSAAAGSGKTATLTERIIRSLTDKNAPADLSRMLIVTFTRAAAAELRSRIFTALSDALAEDPTNRHLSAQLTKLGSARICTIDSFYLELIRSNFAALGLSPSFRISDTAEAELMEKELMSDTVDFFYENDPEFGQFAECFAGIRETDKLESVFLKLASRLRSVPEGIGFLQKQAEQTESQAELDFFSTSFGTSLRENTRDMLEQFARIFGQACDYILPDKAYAAYCGASFAGLRDFCAGMAKGLADGTVGYADAKAGMESFQVPPIGRMKSDLVTRELARYKKLRTDFSSTLRKLTSGPFSKSPEVISRAMHDTARYTRKLYALLDEFECRLEEEKKRRNLLDFSDIRRYAMKLLVAPDGTPTPVARSYAEQFSEIYIDEYQDVDRVQDEIFCAISRPDNRFMVGDIKQSIYGFRGAEPQVFADYRAAFPDRNEEEAQTSDSAAIFMSENFRCDRSIIDFTNLVCSRIFYACRESIGYRREDDLICAKLPPDGDYTPPPVELTVITVPPKSRTGGSSEEVPEEETDLPKRTKAQWEAFFIARKIRELLSGEKKADGTPILPGDIAVLFRSGSMSTLVSDELHALGIRTSESDASRYFENPDVLMMLCLLNTVDNPQRDIPLSGILRSPLFEFTLEDLVTIRNAATPSHSLYDALLFYAKEGEEPLAGRCREFDRVLQDLRIQATSLPVDRFLQAVFDSELFLSSGLLCGQDETGDAGNLLRLYDYARTFEAGSFKGLYNFIEFLNTMIENQKKLDSPSGGVSPDKVSLMTIHSSKGLEFPVCFVCGTGSAFNSENSKNSLLFDYPTGVAMKISDETGFARINTPMREAVLAASAKKQTEEEMRVLYVALTRARERLYVTGTSGRGEQQLIESAEDHACFGGRYTVLHTTSYLGWMLDAIAENPEQTACRVSFLDVAALEAMEGAGECADTPEDHGSAVEQTTETDISPDPELLALLEEKYRFRYPYTSFSRIPSKLSVSRLSPDVLDENDESMTLSFGEARKTPVPDFFREGVPHRSPLATDRGTATHLFLQFCDFDRLFRYGVDEEFARLCELRFLPGDAKELIRFDELRRFCESDLAAVLKSAGKIYREQRFNILLPPDEFTRDPEFLAQIRDERLAVQGVIDLIVIDSEGRLCLYDYKTDRLTREELTTPALAMEKMNGLHALQLSYYAKAAQMLFGRPCDRLCVYSTQAARLFDIAPIGLKLPQNES